MGNKKIYKAIIFVSDTKFGRNQNESHRVSMLRYGQLGRDESVGINDANKINVRHSFTRPCVYVSFKTTYTFTGVS